MKYTLFLLLLLQIIGGVSTTQVVTGTLGRTIFFYQSISDRLSLRWSFKNDLIVSRIYEFFVEYAPKYKGRCQLYSDGTLRLDNLTSTDEGQYTFTTEKHAPSEVYLRVFRAVSTTQGVNGTLGRSIYFYESFPDQTLLLEWSFQNNLIASRIPGYPPECAPQYKGRCQMYYDGTLRLDNLTLADKGTYFLSAQQSLSIVIKEAIYELKVHSALFATYWMNGILGRSIYFNESFSDQALLLQWSFKNKVIASQIPGYISGCIPQYTGRCQIYDNGTLRLDHLTLADDGAYTLTAQDPSSTVIREAVYDLRVYSAVSATQVVNGTKRRSIYFYEFFSDQTLLLQWNFKNKLFASRIPGYPPNCTRICQLYDDGTLRLDNLRPEDEGAYSFTAQQPSSTVIREAVYELRVFSVLSSFQRIHEIVGKEVVFYTFNSDQTLLLQWSFKNNLIASRIPGYLPSCIPQYAGRCQMYDNGPLRLKNLTLADDGIYLLTAHQPPSTVRIEHAIELNVYVSAPKNAGHENNTITKLKVGETLILSVILVPELKTDFDWYHLNPNPIPIQTNSKVSVNYNISSSSLQIKNVTGEDAGKYECRVRHGFGSQRFLFTVNVAKRLSGGAIAGIVIGVLLGVILIGTTVGFYFFRRKKSPMGLKKKDVDEIPPNIYEEIMTVENIAATPK